MEMIEMKKKSYSSYGFILEIASKIDRMPDRMNVWHSIFGELDFFAAEKLISEQIEKEGLALYESYRANPVGNANRGMKVDKVREIRYSVTKLIAFADRAGLDLSKAIKN